MVDQGARDGRENDDTDDDADRGLTSAEAARLLAEGMARLAASASDRHAALLSIAEGYDET